MMLRFTQFIRTYALWFIIALSVFPFVSLVQSGFVSDDWEFLYHASELPYTAERMLGTNTNGHNTGGSYRPIVNVYWGTMYQLFGESVVPYRISIIVLQILAIVLVYQVVRRLKLGKEEDSTTIALVAAALFALFPGRVEALSWIAVINDTLLVPLILGSWLGYVLFLDSKRWYYLVLSLLGFALALGTKEIVVTFPAILAGTYILRLVREEQHTFKSLLKHAVHLCVQMTPYALVLVLFFALRYQIIGFVTEDYTGTGFSLLQNNPMRAYASMLVGTLLVDPLRTTVSYALYQFHAWVIVVLLYAAGMIAVRARLYTMVLATVLASWYALAIFPASRFGVNMWHVLPSAEGERYTYYPSILLAIMIATPVVYVWHRYSTRTIVRVALISVGVLYALYATVGTVQKVSYWRTASERSETLRTSFITVQQEAAYDGVVIVGLPDALYGAFMWRNAFALTVSDRDDTKLAVSDILITPIRSLPVMGASASVQQRGTDMRYEATAPILTSSKVLDTSDYRAEHIGDIYREPLSISYTDFTNGILLTPSESFISQNSEKHIGFFFFDGVDGWIHLPLTP